MRLLAAAAAAVCLNTPWPAQAAAYQFALPDVAKFTDGSMP